MTSMVVTMLRSGDLDEMAAPLTAAKLPIADLGEPGRTFFRFGPCALSGHRFTVGLAFTLALPFGQRMKGVYERRFP